MYGNKYNIIVVNKLRLLTISTILISLLSLTTVFTIKNNCNDEQKAIPELSKKIEIPVNNESEGFKCNDSTLVMQMYSISHFNEVTQKSLLEIIETGKIDDDNSSSETWNRLITCHNAMNAWEAQVLAGEYSPGHYHRDCFYKLNDSLEDLIITWGYINDNKENYNKEKVIKNLNNIPKTSISFRKLDDASTKDANFDIENAECEYTEMDTY
jgi:hypothetical protein